jgi:hypothetical protein
MGEMRNAHKMLVGQSEGKIAFGGPSVDERIILKWILKKQGVRVWTRFKWLRIRSSSRLL